ncbi:MAG TPA: hypothetical protein VE553_05905 [Candidatus Binatia bacterium]|nr:hypothetical protein [Candidatus Binatia bacterium]
MSDEHRTPHVSDADLLAYLDGVLEEELARHIERSPGYRHRLEELARQERRMLAHVYRGTCPDAQELGEYHMDLLAPERAAIVAQHLEICPRCASELNELRAFLDELAPELEYNLLERVRVLIARLVPDFPSVGGALMPAPALAGMRGEVAGPLLYEADDVQVSVEVQDDGAHAGRKSVLGVVTGGDAAGWQATLWQDMEQVQTQSVDDLGNFVFEALPAGGYRLTLRGDEVEIVIQDLAVT